MDKVVIDTSGLRGGRRKDRGRPKGRQVDPKALAEVRVLLGDAPRRRDLLIEFLHRIQDTYGFISAPHIVALAAEMSLAMTEVYEVATFYHHFDVVKDGDAPPPRLTVRVCETLSCRMAGSQAVHDAVANACGPDVRVIGAPCIGRCEHAPAAVVGRNPIDRATPEAIMKAIAGNATEPVAPECIDYEAYRRAEASSLAPYPYTRFVFAAVLGYFIFSDPIRPATLVGAVMIALSNVLPIVLARRKKRKHRQVDG
jgi:formate dehydrogenase